MRARIKNWDFRVRTGARKSKIVPRIVCTAWQYMNNRQATHQCRGTLILLCNGHSWVLSTNLVHKNG